MGKRIILWSVGAAAVAVAAGVLVAASKAPPSPGEALRAEKLEPRFERLKPLHTAKTPPMPADWMAQHPETPQSVKDYLDQKLPRATQERRTIYFLPIGEFAGARKKVLDSTVEYTRRYYGLPVKVLDPVALSEIPASARRKHPTWGMDQILAPYVNEKLLAVRKPADAVAMLGLTAVDLYPEPSWNFVFGEAEPDLGVGVWSIFRNGDPEKSAQDFRVCLRRTMATAVHEIGHLFGLAHCQAWECQMNGTNHLAEADSRPMEFCPACQQKLVWFSGADPLVRVRGTAALVREQGLANDADFFEKEVKALSAP